jgi:hypothetical protein
VGLPVDAWTNEDRRQRSTSAGDRQADGGWDGPLPDAGRRPILGVHHDATGCCELAHRLDHEALRCSVGFEHSEDPHEFVAVGTKSELVVPESSIDDRLESFAKRGIERRNDQRRQHDRRVGLLACSCDEDSLGETDGGGEDTRQDRRKAAEAIRAEHGTNVGILVLSQYVETTFALRLVADGAGGVGYLLKDRVDDLEDFTDAIRRIAKGAPSSTLRSSPSSSVGVEPGSRSMT